jgi:xanthine dehydrogenase accessory factor
MACLDADSGSVELIRVAGDDPTLGQRWLFADQQLIATWPAGLAAEPARTRLPAPTARPRPSCTDGWAVLPMAAPITLLIVGGGHVGQTVARLAAEVDFHVWILDDRDRYASEERFPQARRRLVGPIGLTLTELTQQQITARTYAVIVTRGHDHDEEALFHLAPSAAGYVGMIGSRRKVRLILTELRERGVPETALARVCAPLGLRIGSQTVPEIAISIVAELIARRNLGTVIVSDGNTETNHRGTEDTEESSTERTTP